MNRIINIITSVVLAALTCCSAVSTAFAAAPAEQAAVSFHSIDEVDEAIQRIFHDHYDELYEMASAGGKLSEVAPEYFTYYWGSCGPMSRAFQKVLADNGIYVEERKQNVNTEMHAYNLMRVSFDGGNTVTNLIIDPTYKQTMRTYFANSLGCSTDAEIDEAIKRAELPDVLVFEFGNRAMLDSKLNAVLSSHHLPHYDVTATINFYENRPYPETELQATYDQYLSPDQIAQVQRIGSLNKPYDEPLYLTGSTDNGTVRYPMTYSDNGIYTCLIRRDDFGAAPETPWEYVSYTGSFTVNDAQGRVLYGAGGGGADVTGYYCYNFNIYANKPEVFLAKDSEEPFTIHCDSEYMLVRIDMRAGIDAPVIVLLPVEKTDDNCFLFHISDSNAFLPLCFQIDPQL